MTFAAVLETTALEASVPLVTLQGQTRESVRDTMVGTLAVIMVTREIAAARVDTVRPLRCVYKGGDGDGDGAGNDAQDDRHRFRCERKKRP